MPAHCRLSAALIVALALCCAAEDDVQQAMVDRFVRELGAESFDLRELAQKKLIALGGGALPHLEKHGKSTDPEVLQRLKKVRDGIAVDAARRVDHEFAAHGFYAMLGQKQKPKNPTRLKPVPTPESLQALTPEEWLERGPRGFKWLAAAQEEDGRWDSVKHGAEQNADIEQTALALLALLAEGHTEKVGLKENVKKAVAWLKSQQRDDGAFVVKGKVVDGIAHALAACAMAEAAGMGRIPDTMQSAQRAVNYSCEHQCGEGSQRGGFGRSPQSLCPDTVTTTFFVLQLKSAKVAGLSVPAAAFEGVLRFLDSVEDNDKHLFKGTPSGEISITASIMGCLARQFTGGSREEVAPCVDAVLAEFKGHLNDDRPDALLAYVGMIVMFQQGGDIWTAWLSKLKPARLERMQKEGANAGSWDPCGERQGIGRVATTALISMSKIDYPRRQPEP